VDSSVGGKTESISSGQKSAWHLSQPNVVLIDPKSGIIAGADFAPAF
jgi:fumarylacetoacetate (FAA) hydrolase family protein